MEAKDRRKIEPLSDDFEELKREVEARYFKHLWAVEEAGDTFEVSVSESVFISVKEEAMKHFYTEPAEKSARLHTSRYGVGSALLLLFGSVGMINDATSTIGGLARLPFAVPSSLFIAGVLGGLWMIFRR